MNNINSLTQYYEAIEQDLKKDSIGINSKLFSTYQQKPYAYDQTTGAFQKTNQSTASRPKKVLQYGWK